MGGLVICASASFSIKKNATYSKMPTTWPKLHAGFVLPFEFDVDEALFAMWQAFFFVLLYSFSQMVFFFSFSYVSRILTR